MSNIIIFLRFMHFDARLQMSSTMKFFFSSLFNCKLKAFIRQNEIKFSIIWTSTFLNEHTFRVFFQSMHKRLFRKKKRVSITSRNFVASAFDELLIFFRNYQSIARRICWLISNLANFIDVYTILKFKTFLTKKYKRQIVDSAYIVENQKKTIFQKWKQKWFDNRYYRTIEFDEKKFDR